MHATLAEADAYFAERGNAKWAAMSEAERQAALVRGADYIRLFYAPRLLAETPDEVIAEAEIIAAGYEAGTSGFFSTSYTPGQRKILTEVKGIKWSVVPESGSSGGWKAPVVGAIDALLAPWLASGAAGGGDYALPFVV